MDPTDAPYARPACDRLRACPGSTLLLLEYATAVGLCVSLAAVMVLWLVMGPDEVDQAIIQVKAQAPGVFEGLDEAWEARAPEREEGDL